MSYFSYRPYVPVAKRREKALRKIKKLAKQGLTIQPVEIVNKKITTTFWGKAWCDHIELFKDYENRLPRGRTYVRNGSVCHLAIDQGLITGMVSGSEIYNISIKINTLEPSKWEHIKKICMGKISSLLDLITGKLSAGVMEVVCDSKNGIFPLSTDIKLSCDCPDYATMCKHIAAVLYGVGSRLDVQPDQLFKLRGVNHEELVDLKVAIDDVTKAKEPKHRHLIDPKLSQIFDIDLSNEDAKSNKKIARKVFTGSYIRNMRKKLKLSCVAFAKKLGVSATTISVWESKGRSRLTLKETSLKALLDL
jgi:uncharacterized Zn finger protein